MDIEVLVKEAAFVGLAVGVITMAAFLVWAFGQYLLRPTVTVAAATTAAVPFGFQATI